jgi:hypothetical protein
MSGKGIPPHLGFQPVPEISAVTGSTIYRRNRPDTEPLLATLRVGLFIIEAFKKPAVF